MVLEQIANPPAEASCDGVTASAADAWKPPKNCHGDQPNPPQPAAGVANEAATITAAVRQLLNGFGIQFPMEGEQGQRPGKIINAHGDQNLPPMQRLQNQMDAAARAAANNVLRAPHWERQFTDPVAQADAKLAANPQIQTKLKEAVQASTDAAIAEKGAGNKFHSSIAALPADEQKQINYLMSIKDGGQQLRKYLAANHPDVLTNMDSYHNASTQADNARQVVSQLQQVLDQPMTARLDYVAFLNLRGNAGDAAAAEALLTYVIKQRSHALNMEKPTEMTHAIRQAAIGAGLSQSPTFRALLENHGVKPDEYFGHQFKL